MCLVHIPSPNEDAGSAAAATEALVNLESLEFLSAGVSLAPLSILG